MMFSLSVYLAIIGHAVIVHIYPGSLQIFTKNQLPRAVKFKIRLQ